MAEWWDAAPKADSFDIALQQEGVTGRLADVARSIYQQESSGGRNTKTSNAGAVGGMQIIPSTFASVADKGWDIADPIQNARAGIRYVKQGYEASGGDPALTGAFYYGGPGGMAKAQRGVAVSDPRNPNAPTTLQYGEQVASRLPKERGLVQRAVEGMIPSANAAPAQGEDWWASAPIAEQPSTENIPRVEVRGTSADEPGAVSRFIGGVAQGSRDLAGGLLRGAGSIGSTLLAPGDAIQDAIAGRPLMSTNNARRSGIDAGLQSAGANPDALVYGAGKLTGEIAGTAGVGGLLANGARAAGATPQLVSALQSGGMTLGPGTGSGVTNALTRLVGGAATGGAAAGLVNPEDARTGAIIGGTLPLAAQGVGLLGQSIGRTIRGPAPAPNVLAAAQAGREAGYVIPPTQVQPSLRNRLLEGASGKITTAQNASARNQDVTNRLARDAIGATELSPEGIRAVRDAANDAYTQLGNFGKITTDDTFRNAVEQAGKRSSGFASDFPELVRKDADSLIQSFSSKGEFDSQSAIEAIKRLREGQRNASNPLLKAEEKEFARLQGKIANALEGVVERNLQRAGSTDLLENFRSARQTLAKAYDIEKALNTTTGTVDAAKLAAALRKGRPLSGELRQAAQFAEAFPKAVQTPERMGSLPQTSPLDWVAAGGLSAATGSPLGALGLVARPAARAATLSPFVQNRLTQQPAQNQLLQLLRNPELEQLVYRSAPVIGAQ